MWAGSSWSEPSPQDIVSHASGSGVQLKIEDIIIDVVKVCLSCVRLSVASLMPSMQRLTSTVRLHSESLPRTLAKEGVQTSLTPVPASVLVLPCTDV